MYTGTVTPKITGKAHENHIHTSVLRGAGPETGCVAILLFLQSHCDVLSHIMHKVTFTSPQTFHTLFETSVPCTSVHFSPNCTTRVLVTRALRPTQQTSQRAQQLGATATPPCPHNISLYGKKEVVLAVQAVGGTTHFVIVFCFFTSDTHMIMLQIFAV